MRVVFLLSVLAGNLIWGQEQVDPWPPQALVEPAAIAAVLSAQNKAKPAVFYVGFPNLYSGAHVESALLEGPASKPAGLESLRQAVRKLPRSRAIVIYCGCCPFEKCPNIRPAFRVLKEEGFTDIEVMHIPTNLHTDWVTKGYPTVRGVTP